MPQDGAVRPSILVEEPVVGDASIDRLIRKVLSSRVREVPGCPREASGCSMDENIVAAYLENRLSSSEKTDFEDHACKCASCQELLALSMQLDKPEPTVEAAMLRSFLPRLSSRILRPVPIFAVLFIGAVSLIFFFRIEDDSRRALEKAQITELHSPPWETKTTIPSPSKPAPEPHDAGLKQEKLQAAAPPREEKSAKAELPSPREHPISPEVALPSPAISTAESREKAPSETERQKGAEGVTLGSDRSVTLSYISATQAKDTEARMVERPGSLPKDIILKAAKAARLKEAESKKIADKTFYRSFGYWFDGQCISHRDADIMEITSADPEYSEIFLQYPTLADFRPIFIYWKGTNFLVR